jgi:hypothetical protein
MSCSVIVLLFNGIRPHAKNAKCAKIAKRGKFILLGVLSALSDLGVSFLRPHAKDAECAKITKEIDLFFFASFAHLALFA